MWGSIRLDSGADSRCRPSIRSPVPQSRITRAPAGVVSSRQAVFPPYRQVALSTVGVDPRTPQNRSVATGSDALLRDGLAIGSAAMDLTGGTGVRIDGNFSYYGPRRMKSINFPPRCARTVSIG